MWKSQLVPMWRYCTQSRILCSEQFTVVVLVIVTAFRSSLLYKPNLLLLFVVRNDCPALQCCVLSGRPSLALGRFGAFLRVSPSR